MTKDADAKEALVGALMKAATLHLSADEVHKQRVSFVMGSTSEKSGITRAFVEEVLAKQAGHGPG